MMSLVSGESIQYCLLDRRNPKVLTGRTQSSLFTKQNISKFYLNIIWFHCKIK